MIHNVKRIHLKGFTIVEMLFVVLVIALLSGMVFAMVKAAAGKQAKAETRKKLEMVAGAVEEYYAEYGKYPPASGEVSYIFPTTNNEYSITIWQDFVGADQVDEFFSHANNSLLYHLVLRTPSLAYINAMDLQGFRGLLERDVYDFELKGHLKPDRRAWYTDSPREARFKERIVPSLKSIVIAVGHDPDKQKSNLYEGEVKAILQRKFTVWDGWGNPLQYESTPPYTSYRLWSKGTGGKLMVAGEE